MSKAKIIIGIKFLILVGMACFIFPFATVSCSAVSYDFNGLELMTSITFKEDFQSSDATLLPNFFLLGAFLLGGFGTFLGWKAISDGGEGSRGAAICTTLATLCMILFPFTFGIYYDLDDVVTVQFQPGYFISLIAYIGGTACSIAYFNGVGIEVTETETESEPPQPTQHASPEAPPLNQPMPPGPKVSVQILYDGAKQTISLRHFPSYIGTNPSFCQIVLQDSALSPIHAQIYADGPEVYMQDMGSRTGTLLNGVTLTEPTEILSGDEAVVGTTRLRFIVSMG